MNMERAYAEFDVRQNMAFQKANVKSEAEAYANEGKKEK